MMKPHFYNLRSRLGMINAPHRQKALNVGVEEGGDAILTEEFLNHFPDASIDTYDFPKPEDVDKKKYFDILAKTLKEAEDLIENTVKSDETPVILGGDNSVSFPTLTATLKQYKPHRVGYVRIDSHPDMNSIKDSPTGNFHGMWMRPFVDGFEHKGIAHLIHHKVSLSQVLFVGNLDINTGEQEFFTGKSTVISPDYLRKNKESALMNVNQFVNIHDHIYLGIDIDAFDQSIAPATGIPAKQGLLLEDVVEIFSEVKKNVVTIDMVEVNPKKNGAEKTVKLAQDILLRLLG